MPTARLSANTATTRITRMIAHLTVTTAPIGLTKACSLALAPGTATDGAEATVGVVDGAIAGMDIAAATDMVDAAMGMADVATGMAAVEDMADIPVTVGALDTAADTPDMVVVPDTVAVDILDMAADAPVVEPRTADLAAGIPVAAAMQAASAVVVMPVVSAAAVTLVVADMAVVVVTTKPQYGDSARKGWASAHPFLFV
jgi:hypothetical protein